MTAKERRRFIYEQKVVGRKVSYYYERTSKTAHEHQLSAIKKNHQGREFVSCGTCGAFSFGD